MRIFTKFGAVAAVVLAAVLAALPVMVENKPGAVLSGLQDWLWLIYPVAVAFLAYAILSLGYFIGRRKSRTTEAAPVNYPGERTIDQLIYSVRTITNAMLEDGELRAGEVEAQIVRLRRDNPAWHGQMQHQARDDFLATVRRAMEAREQKTSWMAGPGTSYGDYPADQRGAFHEELQRRRDNLEMVLQAQQFHERRHR